MLDFRRVSADSAFSTEVPSKHALEIEANLQRQHDRHVAERFARAMELLGNQRPEVRWGGIFALERVARRSPQDQSTVAEVLAAYVRRHAAWKPSKTAPDGRVVPIASEVQLILTVLGRRKWPYKGEDRPLDLHATNLAKAHLPFVHLESAFLYDCNLESALLVQAHLQGAWLARSNLKYANLDGAYLGGADLTDAVGLTEEQLRHARLDEKTVLPPQLSYLVRQRKD